MTEAVAQSVNTNGSSGGEGQGQVSAPMVAALEQAWAATRARHPDVPPVVVVLGAGSIGAPSGRLRLGHFAAMRWADGAGEGERLAEVFVGGEGLARGPAARRHVRRTAPATVPRASGISS